jgi:hypothetical protein
LRCPGTCADPDQEVTALCGRSRKADASPYVFLDATASKATVNRRPLSRAIVVATAAWELRATARS